MRRLIDNTRGLTLTAIATLPVLAQTSGCLDPETVRQSAASIATQMANAGLNSWVSTTVNRMLDLPTSMFGF